MLLCGNSGLLSNSAWSCCQVPVPQAQARAQAVPHMYRMLHKSQWMKQLSLTA